MHDSFLDKSDEAITDLLEKVNSLTLRDVRMLFDVMLKIIIADLLNDVVIMAALHDVEHLHDILGLEQLKDLYLREERRFEVIVMIDLIVKEILRLFSSTLMAHGNLLPSCSPR